jgi:hypothetical protein
MKQNRLSVLSFLLLLIGCCNTAFVILPKQTSTISTSIATTPPQYKTKKMSFFEQFTLKIAEKKATKPVIQQNNLNKTANTSIYLGGASILANIGIILLWQSSSSAIMLLGLLLPAILGFIAIIISVMVLTKLAATPHEKKLARIGILLGILGLIISAILFALTLFAVAAP